MPIAVFNLHGKKLLSVQGFAPKKRKGQQAAQADQAAWLRFESPITSKEATEAARSILERARKKGRVEYIGKDVARVAQKLLVLGAFAYLYADRSHQEPSPLSWCDIADEETLDYALAHLAAWQPALAIGSFVKSVAISDEEIVALQARNTALEDHNAALQARVETAEARLAAFVAKHGNVF